MAAPMASGRPVDSFFISDQTSFLLDTSACGSSSPSGKCTRNITTVLTRIGLINTQFHSPLNLYSTSKLLSKGRDSWMEEAYGIFLNLLSLNLKPDIVKILMVTMTSV